MSEFFFGLLFFVFSTFNFRLFKLKKYIKSDFGNKSEITDLDGDQKEEIYKLEGGKLSVVQSSQLIWQTPNNWWIDHFVIADSNNDGNNNLNLSVWRAGSFGESRPFWVKKRDWRVRNHFFVFSLKNDQIRPVWQSSSLSRPNCQFLIADINEDRKNELVVIEGSYKDIIGCQGEYLAVWQWSEWGFYNLWRSEKGSYDNIDLEVVKLNYEKL